MQNNFKQMIYHCNNYDMNYHNQNKHKFCLKNKYNTVIPANIFQTWNTKHLPPLMHKSIELIKQTNKGFRHYLFDDNDCRDFIKNNFDASILNAYDSLVPGAYKSDLWRYCILYKYGGIYLDVKYMPVNGFKFIHLLEEEHFPLDLNNTDIYNALLVCKPQNEILLKAIQQIVSNVQHHFYGKNSLEPTGPALLGNMLTSEIKKNSKIKHIILGNDDADKYINYENCLILRCYPGYFIEREKYSKIKHYSQLWNQKKIYKKVSLCK